VHGFEAAEVLRAAPLGVEQETAWHPGTVVQPGSWLALATGRPAVLVPRSGYASLAASAPGDSVMVGDVRCVDGSAVASYEIRPAPSLVERPPALDFCFG